MSGFEVGCYLGVVLLTTFLVAVWYAVLRMLQRVLAPRVFISYRRNDRSAVAAQLNQALARRYVPSNVYFDVSMDDGKLYPDTLTGWLGTCDVLVAVIGPTWDGRDQPEDRPRVFRTEDWVHHEVRYGLETRNNLIVVHARGPDDPTWAEVPKYAMTQLDRWKLSPPEHEAIGWITKLRLTPAVQVSLDNQGRLVGVEQLANRIDERHLGSGRRWLTWWKWTLCLVVGTGLLFGLVAHNAAAVGDLTDRSMATEKTLRNLEGVYINPLPVNDFVSQYLDDHRSGKDFKRYRLQYVCWKLKIVHCEVQPGSNRRYQVLLRPDDLPAGSHFDVYAYFDELEFKDQVAGVWDNGNGTGKGMYLSGRITDVKSSGVILSYCRVVIGRENAPPRK